MRIASFLAALLLLCGLSLCQSSATSDVEVLSKLVSELPKCVLTCAMKHADPDCPLTSLKCACQPTSDAAMACYFDSCKGWDLILGQKLIDKTCGVVPLDDDVKLRIQIWVSAGLAGLVVAVRIASGMIPGLDRSAGGRTNLGWDDACVVLSFLLSLATFAVTEDSIRHGFGRGLTSASNPKDVDTQVRGFLIGSTLMFAAAAAIKASFLFFFARIFLSHGLDDLTWPLVPRIGPEWRFKTVLVWTHVVNVVSAVALICMALVQCQPLSYYWTGWDGMHTGYCFYNKRIAPLTHIIVTVILDFWFLYLPIPLISTLRMSIWTKVGITSMFSLGIIVTIVSLIRLYVLVREMQHEEMTSNYVEIAKWSTAEMPTAIVCACIPSLRWFFLRMMPDSFRRGLGKMWHKIAALWPGYRRKQRRRSQRLDENADESYENKYKKRKQLSTFDSYAYTTTVTTTTNTANRASIALEELGSGGGTPGLFVHSEDPEAAIAQSEGPEAVVAHSEGPEAVVSHSERP
ncbi:hypothetical protein MAPG_12029 [Magnaporthiopsis poae ATCC 64411]|uniref:Rhodopsin domain-containing protein n=1 Tax=Magnaporthiopsis poae (strain ATCC 64411 / 73-15) TaxID=644358 RepID=A0A0C4EGP7_MAGP6|nr:hypothetical protein MAPG_12029 [Magnaporthiopsis poae ATCC 64411]